MAGHLRLPFEPVDGIVKGRVHPSTSQRERDALLGEALGSDARTVQRWRSTGVSVWWADKIAITLGFLPWELWGDDWCEMVDGIIDRRQRKRFDPERTPRGRALAAGQQTLELVE